MIESKTVEIKEVNSKPVRVITYIQEFNSSEELENTLQVEAHQLDIQQNQILKNSSIIEKELVHFNKSEEFLKKKGIVFKSKPQDMIGLLKSQIEKNNKTLIEKKEVV